MKHFLTTMTNKRRIKRLEDDCKTLAKEQTNLTLAYDKLSTTAADIGGVIAGLKARDFTGHHRMIDALNLDDAYKSGLKTELCKSRDLAIQTLGPLQEKTEKLRGNMVVAQEKALHYLAVVRAQADILGAGEIQVEIVKSLREQGAELNDRVDELLAECERINGLTRDAVKHANLLSAPSSRYLESNPMVEKHGA